ncbi:hypothetical protein B0A52_07651 [Exophiala mesophila]|uniref:AB hydrolase-1 domain-containing protein n=1 Tax=Exophiala mesophila TaxID=212818 RepID=A0A438MZP4_EXOME|nr:hypothetical protein B0A52_07651 [Exophiala mesophila]
MTLQPLATESIIIRGHRIAYGTYGAGEPIVFVHGTPSSSLIWRHITPRLVSAGFKVHVFDLLGYGLSERPWDPQVDTSITGQVPVLQGLLDHWGLKKFHLVAHDIGGAVAQRFAIFFPQFIQSLTMIDVVSFDSYPSARTKQQMLNGLENLIKASDSDHRAHFRDWLLSAVYHKQRLVDSSLVPYLEYISGPVGQPSFFFHQVRHYDSKHTMEVAPRYHELGNRPVKLIWGRNDAWQTLVWADKLNKAIPGSELDIIDECGHFSPEDQPDKIADLLLEFWKRH